MQLLEGLPDAAAAAVVTRQPQDNRSVSLSMPTLSTLVSCVYSKALKFKGKWKRSTMLFACLLNSLCSPIRILRCVAMEMSRHRSCGGTEKEKGWRRKRQCEEWALCKVCTVERRRGWRQIKEHKHTDYRRRRWQWHCVLSCLCQP